MEAEARLRELLLAEERRRCLKAEVFALDAQEERTRAAWRRVQVMRSPEARRRYYELLDAGNQGFIS